MQACCADLPSGNQALANQLAVFLFAHRFRVSSSHAVGMNSRHWETVAKAAGVPRIPSSATRSMVVERLIGLEKIVDTEYPYHPQ